MPLFGSKKTAEAVVGITDKTVDIVEKLVPDKDKKQEIASEIINNEMASGSGFVKFARPSIIYTGLIVILLEIFGIRLYIIDSIGGESVIKASNAMLEYFLFTWGGICSIYIGGRSYEKAKMRQHKRRIK